MNGDKHYRQHCSQNNKLAYKTDFYGAIVTAIVINFLTVTSFWTEKTKKYNKIY